MDQAKIAFLDEVQQRQATIEIASSDFDNQPQIALNHPVPGGLVAVLRKSCVVFFFVRSQEWRDSNLAEIYPCRIRRIRPHSPTSEFQGAVLDQTVVALSRRQKLSRVNRLAVASDFKMQSRLAFRPLTHGRYALAFVYFLAFFHQQRRVVPVGTQVGVVMFKNNKLSVADQSTTRVDDGARKPQRAQV